MKNFIKRIAFTLTLSAILYSSALAQQSSKFVINGVLKNFKTVPDKVFLIYPAYEGKKPDSSDVVNGTYKFVGEIEEDALPLQIALGPELDMMSSIFDLQARVIVTAGETKIVSDRVLYNYVETGAAGQLFDQYRELYWKYTNPGIVFSEQRNSFGYRTREAMRTSYVKKYQNDTKNYFDDHYNFIVQHPKSPLVPELAFNLLNIIKVKQKADSLIEILSATTIKSKVRTATLTKLQDKSKELAAKLATSAGKPAPDFSQNDVNGNAIKLSSFRGKYVLVDFWASWCAPCRAENPNVVKAYAKYHNKNFEILGVSLDSESAKNAWNAAIKSDGLTWPQVSDLKGWKNEAAKLFAVTAIPQNFLIDPKGQIIATNLRGEALEQALEKFLK
ncbi:MULTISPECIES: TlpA disulfide reductase family protein [Pedobacter]|uniref:TlpA disulfide reductase family protein n=1 Tax=Pedobacter TaxID=84567 RepID=UPI00292FC305|nr:MULTISPECIES: TlpA disulfide reductase family protein [Pedobacter]